MENPPPVVTMIVLIKQVMVIQDDWMILGVHGLETSKRIRGIIPDWPNSSGLLTEDWRPHFSGSSYHENYLCGCLTRSFWTWRIFEFWGWRIHQFWARGSSVLKLGTWCFQSVVWSGSSIFSDKPACSQCLGSQYLICCLERFSISNKPHFPTFSQCPRLKMCCLKET